MVSICVRCDTPVSRFLYIYEVAILTSLHLSSSLFLSSRSLHSSSSHPIPPLPLLYLSPLPLLPVYIFAFFPWEDVFILHLQRARRQERSNSMPTVANQSSSDPVSIASYQSLFLYVLSPPLHFSLPTSHSFSDVEPARRVQR